MQKYSVGSKKGMKFRVCTGRTMWTRRWNLRYGTMNGVVGKVKRRQDKKGELTRWNGAIVSSANRL